jgi:curli biogenesis system outer membrane secretion channel CsgG
MRRRTIALTAAVAATTFGSSVASLRAQDVPTVAVMDFSSFMMGDGGGAVNLGKAISAMLVTEFSGRPGMRIVERQEINDLIREQDLSLSGRIEEADAIEVGKLLGVQYVLHGQVTSIVDNLRMDIRAVDVETSEIVTVMKKSDKTSELFAVVVGLADEFGAALHLVPPSQRPPMESIPVPATIAFSRGVDYEDRGEKDAAIEQYEAALKIHPNHRDARRALERLRGSN